MSRVFATVLVLALLLIGPWLAALWSRAASGGARISASERLSDVYMARLCRPPDDRETVRWDSRSFETDELVDALGSSPEGRRVEAVRHVFLAVLGRDPLHADCRALRRWVDGSLSTGEIARGLAQSREARRVGRVRRAIVDALGRDPAGWDNATLRRWVDSEFTPAGIRRRVAAQRPLVGVHYFAWYEPGAEGWGNDKTVVPGNAPKPSLGWYDSSDPGVIDTHLEQIAAAGFDFVVAHVNAESPSGWANVRALFDRLGGHGLRAAVMVDGFYTRTADFKAMWVARAQADFTTHPRYFFLHGRPLLMLYSSPADLPVRDLVLRNVYWTDDYAPGANRFHESRVLYGSDWPFWAPTPQPVVNGVVPVIPGYADTHLGRERPMEHPRNGGRMYQEQWQRALALRPEIILVYSWNEHFEQTAIEPTAAWGDRYLRWTACYIAHARAGTRGAC